MKKSQSHESRRCRRALGFSVGALALLSVGLWLVFGRNRPAVVSVEPGASVESAAPATWRVAETRQAPRFALPVLAPPAGPRIERIDVDKTEVCYGEENFATVHAADASGKGDRLISRLAGSREMGFRMPFHFERSDSRHARQVIVTGPGGPPAVADIPEVKLKDCDAPLRVSIDVRTGARSPHLLTLSAAVSTADGAPFEAVAYEWSFGDGSEQIVDQAEVEHSYEGLSSRTRFSYLLMTVKAKDRRGREATGSRAYGFPNFGFGELVENHRILVLSAGGSDPGSPASADERIRLYHGYDKMVKLERVRSTELSRSDTREGRSVEYSAISLLGVSELAPGKSTTTRDLSSLRPTEPGKLRKLELIGHAGDVEAHGTIVLTSTASVVEPATDEEALAAAPPVPEE